MTTYAFPSITPNTSKWEIVSNTDAFISPNNTRQTRDRGGEYWRVSMNFNNLTGDDKAEMQAFLVKLNGMQHRFTLYDHSKVQRGNFGGTPLVNGAGQTGTSINIDGVTNTTDWIRAGDHFAVDGDLKMAIADADSAAGAVTILFGPRIVTAPSDGAAITTTNPTGVFMLDAKVSSWSNRAGDFGDFSIVCIEDVLA